MKFVFAIVVACIVSAGVQKLSNTYAAGYVAGLVALTLVRLITEGIK